MINNVINDLKIAKRILASPFSLDMPMRIKVGQAIMEAIELLEQMPLPEKPEDTAEVVVSGNCMVCGKQLNRGRLFVCKECESNNVLRKEREEK